MASPVDVKKGTDQIKRMGQTAGAYGNDPMVEARGEPGSKPRDLKP
jgi:hypothetical protein